MTLYDINSMIDNFLANNVNAETGEVEHLELLDALQLQKAEKLESIGIAYKNAKAEVEALKAEKRNIEARIEKTVRTVESLSNYMKFALSGEKFKTAKVEVSYRKSESVVIDNLEALPNEFLKVVTEVTPDKVKIKQAIKDGKLDTISGRHIESKTNILIK